MCDRLNSLICNDRLNSQWWLRHPGDSGTQELLGKSWIQFVLSKFCFIICAL